MVLVVRLGEIVLIHDLKRQGLSVTAIARQLGLDRKTVRRHLERGLEPPAYGPRAPRPTLIEPFEDYLAARVAAYRSFRASAFCARSANWATPAAIPG